MQVGDVAGAVGRGLAAGMLGTAAMTVSSSLEAKLRDRGSSTTPAQAAGEVLGVEPRDEQGEQRFNQLAHWGYGTALGGIRGLIGIAGLTGTAATVAHLAAVWGGEQVVLPGLDVSSPTWKFGPEEFAIDGLHHVVYALGTAAAWSWLQRH